MRSALGLAAAAFAAASAAATPTATPTSTSTSTSAPNATATPAPLPPPLPAPDAPPAAAPGQPDDALDLLWSHRLAFAADGTPTVTIRIGQATQGAIVVRLRRGARLVPRGGGAVDVPAGAELRIDARDTLPAHVAHHAVLAEAPWARRAQLEAARRLWEGRGVKVERRVTGALYGMAGRVVDARRVLLLAGGDGSEAAARAFADAALARYGAGTSTYAEVLRRPAGRVEVRDGSGATLADGDALATLDMPPDGTFTVAAAAPAAERAGSAPGDRVYAGRLHLTVDAAGRLTAILALPLEELLRGVVPSEIPASAPREALRAQAVTARSNVLAQLGTRHLTDPHGLCDEVHCQAYRGAGAHVAATDAAVAATAGEALLARADGALVDAVYSAMCGGHGEDNDAVWPAARDASLRGRPDLPPRAGRRWAGGLAREARLRAFLADGDGAYCGAAHAAPRDRFRWERRLGPAALAHLGQALGVGTATRLEVRSRGVSGRARTLRVIGTGGAAVVEGELRIRRLLENAPSAMFVVDPAPDGLLLRGGGWGHGAGMCQWGAIGRAEAGQGYPEILRAYYSGAEVARVYGEAAAR